MAFEATEEWTKIYTIRSVLADVQVGDPRPIVLPEGLTYNNIIHVQRHNARTVEVFVWDTDWDKQPIVEIEVEEAVDE